MRTRLSRNLSNPGGRGIKSIQDAIPARMVENGLLEARDLHRLSPTAASSHQSGEPLLVSRDSTRRLSSVCSRGCF